MIKAFITAEGAGTRLCPDFHMAQEALRLLTRGKGSDAAPGRRYFLEETPKSE